MVSTRTPERADGQADPRPSEDRGPLLDEIVAGHARRHPDRVALSARSGSTTYGELDERADRLAARLTDLGVGPDVLVGLCAPRGTEAVVAMLGILRAGGAYVPIDPAYPAQRIAMLLADCEPAVVVTAAGAGEVLAGWTGPLVWTELDEDPPVEPGARSSARVRPARARSDRDLAYVIHTSGSTGTPKGVLVEHRNVVRLFRRTDAWFGFGPDDVWTLFHSISFDFSVWEIWGALLHGGRLVVLPEMASRSPELLVKSLREEGVTVLNQTPSAFRMLTRVALDGNHDTTLPDLRLVIFGGERLEPRMLGPWITLHGAEHPRLVNMYGITETTVHVMYRPITTRDLDADPSESPIGVPLPDLRVELLDPGGLPVPDGVTGEMYVAGGGVTRGYLNRPELTAARFVVRDDPRGGPGPVRFYRTGDLAVRDTGGEFSYRGRIDDQLKVRGYRIEPAEVEEHLSRVPGVAAVVVTARDHGDGDVRLVAHVLPSMGAPPELAQAVERRARAVLPRHLRPASYELVSEIPMTLQGKVDRDALCR